MSTRTRVILGLGLVSALGGALVVPYQLALLPDVAAQLPLPVWAVCLVSGLQTGLLCTLLSWVGLRAGDALELGAPRIEAWLEGATAPWRQMGVAVLVGFLGGLALAAIDGGLLMPLLPEPIEEIQSVGGVVALGASVYGAVVEEVLLRLFLLTGVAWLLSYILSRDRAVGVALVAAALLFGVGHLPTAAALWPLTPVVVARILGLNMLFGLLFGGIYVRLGLATAMAAHFGADLGLHVVWPMISG